MRLSKIEWTDATWNPVTGCTKVSAGCKFCYAESLAVRLQAMGVNGYDNGFEVSLLPDRLAQPSKVTKPTRFFVNSMSDLFHPKVPFAYIEQVFDVINDTPQHQYQILTKRAPIMSKFFSIRSVPSNAWLGVSVENKRHGVPRIDFLREINASVRFLSIEPLLEDLGSINLNGINWVIVGGESGHNARLMEQKWVDGIFRQCKKQNVIFFFKQWGTWGQDKVRRSKKANGRKYKGKIWDMMPINQNSEKGGHGISMG